MKRIALCLAVVAALTVCPKSSEASDLTRILRIAFGTDHHHYRHAARQAHAQHHVDLQAREIERAIVHQAAHQQPLTYRQHGRLHNALDRAAYEDLVEHDVAHATRAYSPRAYAPRYIQNYQAAPYGYGAPYGSFQYRPSQYENRIGCSPYGRY